MENKCAFGLSERTASVLIYVFTWIGGIVFLIAEKHNKNVKFNALQAIVWFIGLFVLSLIFSWIPVIGWLIGLVIFIVMVASYIYFIVSSAIGNVPKVPVLGDFIWNRFCN